MGYAIVAFIVAFLLMLILGFAVSWSVGVITGAVISLVGVVFLFKAFQARTGAQDAIGNHAKNFFADLNSGNDDFPPLFGTTPRRPARPASPRPSNRSTTPAPADNCGSAYADPSLHGVDTDCEHSARIPETYTPTGTNVPDFTKSDTGTGDAGTSSTGSSDGGSSSSTSSSSSSTD
jgi:hypothetical protein